MGWRVGCLRGRMPGGLVSVLGVTAMLRQDLHLGQSYPLEAIVAVLDIVRELDGRKFAVEDRDDYHIGLPAHGLTEMILRVEVAVHPSTAMVIDNDGAQLRARIRDRRLVDTDGDVGGNLLVT